MKAVHGLSIQGLMITALLASCPISVANAEEQSYLDDRSSPQNLIRSLYNAIDRKEFGRAYSYFSEKPAKTFEDYAKGFDDTDKVDVLIGVPEVDAGAGTVNYRVPVALQSLSNDGDLQVFRGCYDLRLSSPSAQTEPFTPLHIVKGKFEPSSENFSDALLKSCENGSTDVDKTALLETRATEIFNKAFAKQCRFATAPEGPPQHYSLSFRRSYFDPSDPDEKADLFRFLCDRGAYNEMHVYLMADSYGEFETLAFAEPELNITYEDNDADKAATEMTIAGYNATTTLVNSDYDPADMTIHAYTKWRGLGDAFSAGTWIFRNGRFSLVQYTVDPSTDGEIDGTTVLDLYSAP